MEFRPTHFQSIAAALIAFAAITVSGCDELDSAAGNGPAKRPLANPGGVFAPSGVESPATTLDPTKPADPTLQKATGGVGKQGQGYGGEGLVTTPIRAGFVTAQRVALDIQIPSAMKLYHAEHNRYPKDFAAFKKEILEPNGVILPELPAGRQYVYDPKTGELLEGPLSP